MPREDEDEERGSCLQELSVQVDDFPANLYSSCSFFPSPYTLGCKGFFSNTGDRKSVV